MRPRLWTRLAFAYVCLLTALLYDATSHVPLPIVDNFHALSVSLGSPWGEALWDGFIRNGHGQHPLEYRPLFFLTVKALHDIAGGPDLMVFRGALAIAFGMLGILMALIAMPSSLGAFIAFAIGFHALLALHTAAAFYALEPISGFLLAQVAIFATLVLLARGRPGLLADAAAPVLTFTALFLIEIGIIVPLMLVAAAVMGNQVVSRRGLCAALTVVAAYGVIRLTVIPSPTLVLPYGGQYYDETGYFCDKLVPEAQHARFGEFPYPFYLYNVVVNGMTVLFSEPRGGQFVFLCSFLNGRTPPVYAWVPIATSLLSTVLLFLWAVRGWRTEREGVVTVLLLMSFLVNIGLGFLYARDRVPSAAGAAYALLLVLALRYWMMRLDAQGRGMRRVLVATCVVLVTLGWSWRTLGTVYAIRYTAWDTTQEWAGPRYEQARERAGTDLLRLALLKRLHSQVSARSVPDPRYDPPWVRRLLSDR